MSIFLVIFLILNSISFIFYGIDKFFAINNKRRISENSLLLFAFISPFGAILGMVIFNHKTSKAKFRFTVPIFNLIQSFAFYYIYFL